MLCLPVALDAGEEAARGAVERPNILIVLADDLGWSDLGCYGGEIHTPNLDALAADGGLRFTQFYNTARCWPTRAALLTGYYAQEVRRDTVPNVRSGGGGRRPVWAPLLPELLRPLGYRTYHSGKWHLDGRPLDTGFDHSYRVEDHDRYFAPKHVFEDDQELPFEATNGGFYLTTAIADHAVRCLREHAAGFRDRPFFQYVAFTSPHFPLQAPAADVARYHDTYRGGWEAVREERWKRLRELRLVREELPAVERDLGPPYDFPDALAALGPGETNRPVAWRELTALQQAFQADKMAIHAAMVDVMDREIGRILDQVKAMGAWRNTLILFLSDNGASAEIMVRGDGHDRDAPPGSADSFLCLGPGWSSVANTPFRRHKTWVHEGGISTPLIVHWPDGIRPRGGIRHTVGHVIDMVPTLLEAAGNRRGSEWVSLPGAPPRPGRSLLPAFCRDRTIDRDFLWWLHEGNRALRIGDWKIVAAKDQPWALYNLRTDRGEIHDLAAQHPDAVREWARFWEQRTDEYFAYARRTVIPTPVP